MASYDYYYKNQVKSLKPKLNSEIDEEKKRGEQQKAAVSDNYNYQINETEKSYEDDYRENAIQKLINERAVAENMANMGLTDSGLNRTQMTATQLSYGNNKAKLDRQKQAQVDALAQQLAASLSEIDMNTSSQIASIRQSYDSLASQNATALANADTEAEAVKYKAEQERLAKQYEIDSKPKTLGQLAYGTLASTAASENEDNVIYTDYDGNSVTMKAGSNPFTGSINKDALDEQGNFDKTKVWDNGYQPNNINGTPLKAIKGNNIVPATMQCSWRTDGIAQKIFTANNKFYVWVGPNNKYYEVEYNYGQRQWVFK